MENTIDLFYAVIALLLFSIVLQVISITKKNKLQELLAAISKDNLNHLGGLKTLLLEKIEGTQANTGSKLKVIEDTMASNKKDFQTSTDELRKDFKDRFASNSNNQANILRELRKQLTELEEAQKSSLSGLADNLNKVEFNQKQSNLSLQESIVSQIHSLRVDNLVSITNELAKSQDLSIETNDFIKQLGDCKVTQIEDKHSGQVTSIKYVDGIKRSSETFAGDLIKYQMLFNEDGRPVQGSEFNDDGNVVFEYFYNEAGEINKRIETPYDQSGNKLENIEIAY